MASNQTEHYKLNQWEAGDTVARLDFNADNAKVDTALHELSEGKAEKSALETLAQAHAADVAALRQENMWVKLLDKTLTSAATSVTLDITDAANYEMLEVHYSMVGAETLKFKINDGIALWQNAENTTAKSVTIFTNKYADSYPLVLAAGHIRIYQGSNITGLLGEYAGLMCPKSYYGQSSGGNTFASTSVNLSDVTKLVLTSTGSMVVGSRMVVYGLKK